MKRSHPLLTFALATLLTLSALFAIAPAHAASFTATRIDDPPPNGCQPTDCSLREAIIAANLSAGPDIITLPADTYTLSIVNSLDTGEDAAASGDLDITSDITLSGAGAATTIIQAGTTSSNGIDRVFDVQPGAQLALSGITVRYGKTNGSYNYTGGGIRNAGTLTLTNSTVSSNTVYESTGLSRGGGIDNRGTLTLTTSTVSGNVADFGGGIYNDGPLTLTTSTVSGNTARNSGGGINNNYDMLTLVNSTVSGNTASSGGGIYNYGGTLTLTTSTVSGNTAYFDGGGIYNNGTLTLASSTIAANRADSDGDGSGTGGGIFHIGTNAVTTLKNTLIGKNTQGTGSTASDCGTKNSSLTSQGYNLIQSITGCTISGDTTGNITGKDPRLGELKDNGGPTQTQALIRPVQGPIFSIIGSPAINAGNPAGCTDAAGQPLLTDQRGVARPQGDRCDIGAFELEQAAPTPSPTPVPSPTPEPSPSPTPSPSPSPAPEPGTLTPRGYLPMMTK